MRILFILFALVAAGAGAQTAVPEVRFVFFDWGKSELSNDAKSTLDKVAADYAAGPRHVILSAHTDRSGSSNANRESSKRRGLTVRDYLIGKGVPDSAITINAYGEMTPIIPTEDGVREVQNRRVEVRFKAP